AAQARKAGILMGRALTYVLLVAYMVVVVFPLCWVLYTSAKNTQQIYESPFGLPKVLTAPTAQNAVPLVDNYTKAWIHSRFNRYFVNSLYVVGISLAGILLLGAMAA